MGLWGQYFEGQNFGDKSLEPFYSPWGLVLCRVRHMLVTVGLGEIGLVDLDFKTKTPPLEFGQEI